MEAVKRLTGDNTMTSKIELIPKDTKWMNKYELQSHSVIFNGKETDKVLIEYKGKFANIASNVYQLVPNELLYETASKVAKKLGLTSYTPKEGNKRWFKEAEFGDGHALVDRESGFQMYACFLDPKKEVNVTGDDAGLMRLGACIAGSVDLSRGISCMPMDFRKICENLMFHLANEGSIQTEATVAQRNRIRDTEKTASLYKRHTSGLDITDLAKQIESSFKQAGVIFERYQEMAKLKITEAQVRKLAKKMPKAVVKDLKWMNIDKLGKVTLLDKSTTQWTAFNNITENLTHTDKSGSLANTMRRYKHVDSILVQNRA